MKFHMQLKIIIIFSEIILNKLNKFLRNIVVTNCAILAAYIIYTYIYIYEKSDFKLKLSRIVTKETKQKKRLITLAA